MMVCVCVCVAQQVARSRTLWSCFIPSQPDVVVVTDDNDEIIDDSNELEEQEMRNSTLNNEMEKTDHLEFNACKPTGRIEFAMYSPSLHQVKASSLAIV